MTEYELYKYILYNFKNLTYDDVDDLSRELVDCGKFLTIIEAQSFIYEIIEQVRRDYNNSLPEYSPLNNKIIRDTLETSEDKMYKAKKSPPLKKNYKEKSGNTRKIFILEDGE